MIFKKLVADAATTKLSNARLKSKESTMELEPIHQLAHKRHTLKETKK